MTDENHKDPIKAPGVPVRLVALNMLDAIFRRGEPLDQIAGRQTKKLEPADAGLAMAIVGEVLRWHGRLDSLIDSVMQHPLAEDAKARMVLRMALAQRLRLGTPMHAVIATSLPLLDGGPKRLAHGVLSTLDKSGAKLPDTPALPEAALNRWWTAWGEAKVEAARHAMAEPPPLDLSFADDSLAQTWAHENGGVSLALRHVRLPRGRAVESLPGFAEGAFWVQDLAASVPARLLGDGKGRRVLDLCAAPGGKSMQLAAAGWHVTALDISEARIRRMEENFARTRTTAQTIRADALKWRPPLDSGHFDAILLDAPCSATGIFRRHPDVLIRVAERQIVETAALQSRMLDLAANWLKPGGTMVYAVCSMEPREGEEQIAAFLAQHPDFTIAPIDMVELPQGIEPTAGYIRTGPWVLTEQGTMDGFFTVRLEKLG